MKIVIFKLMDYNAAELNFRGRGPAPTLLSWFMLDYLLLARTCAYEDDLGQ